MNNYSKIVREMSYIVRELLTYEPVGFSEKRIDNWIKNPKTLTVKTLGCIEGTSERNLSSYTIHIEKVDDKLIEMELTLLTLQNGEKVLGSHPASLKIYLTKGDLGSMLINMHLQLQSLKINVREYKMIEHTERSFGEIIYTEFGCDKDTTNQSLELYELHEA